MWTKTLLLAAGVGCLAFAGAVQGQEPAPVVIHKGEQPTIRMSVAGTYRGGFFSTNAAQTPTAYDFRTKRLFYFSQGRRVLEIIDVTSPARPRKIRSITDPSGTLGIPTSLAFSRGLLGIAFSDFNDVEPGRVLFGNADGDILAGPVAVGPEPGAAAFTPDGRRLVVANIGEANDDYSIDPEGSISIITLNRSSGTLRPTVVTADFRAFNTRVDELGRAGIRIYGPLQPTVAQDLEPESVAISPDSRTAFVTLERNNAVAVVDLEQGKVTNILPMGGKDNSRPPNALDASDEDSEINIETWPLRSLYQPDGIAAFRAFGRIFLALANEGDPREAVAPRGGFPGFIEEARVREVPLDATAFRDREELQQDENLGRLKVSVVDGDTDGDGDLDELYAFGGRSFSIRQVDGRLVFDSGDQFERIVAEALPEFFNAAEDTNDFDDRSDDRGPEPEQLAVGQIGSRQYAFIAPERIGGVFAYDITCPWAPRFEVYINNRNFALDPEEVCEKDQPQSEACMRVGDLEPESVLFISASESPNGTPLVVLSHEASDSVTLFRVDHLARRRGLSCRGRSRGSGR